MVCVTLTRACRRCWHYPLAPPSSSLLRQKHCDVATNLTSPTGDRVKRPPMLSDVGRATVGSRKGTCCIQIKLPPTLYNIARCVQAELPHRARALRRPRRESLRSGDGSSKPHQPSTHVTLPAPHTSTGHRPEDQGRETFGAQCLCCKKQQERMQARGAVDQQSVPRLDDDAAVGVQGHS